MWFSVFIIIILFFLILARFLLTNNNWHISKHNTYGIALLMALLMFAIYISVGNLSGVMQRNFFNEHKGEILSALNTWQKNPLKVAKVLENRLLAHPKDMTARRLLANLYLRQKNYKKAKIVLQPAFNADAEDITVSLLMAEILQRQNNFNKSILILNRIINNKNTTAGGLWVAAKLAMRAQQSQLALKAFRLARAILVTQGKDVSDLDKAINSLI